MSTKKIYENTDCHLVLGSMTAALRAQRILQREGIPGTVVKMTGEQRNGGCSYGLSVPCAQFESAKHTLRGQGISPRPQ